MERQCFTIASSIHCQTFDNTLPKPQRNKTRLWHESRKGIQAPFSRTDYILTFTHCKWRTFNKNKREYRQRKIFILHKFEGRTINNTKHKDAMKRLLLIITLLASCWCTAAAQEKTFTIKGQTLDARTREGLPYCKVSIEGNAECIALSDSSGYFKIENAKPGIFRLHASCFGYKGKVTAEYLISSKTPHIEIELEEDSRLLGEIAILPTPMERTTESPVSMHVIGVQDIEKMPGANRDVSRIVRSFPGVSFSPIGYRNDLIVRGGGPSENRFFMDGIEIPNINHFATQGASGGPTSIINSDLIREINFHTGAFPANRSGALSSVLDFNLKEGNTEKQTFKATLGASEVSLSGNGHIGKKTTYLFSIRQSYLQLLFKLLRLPLLPNYIDGQFKIKSKLTKKDEFVIMGLGGIDRMKLNTDEKGERNEYMLSYLPKISQDSYTLGSSYKRYNGNHTQGVYLSHNFQSNRLLKYNNNDESRAENLRLKTNSIEQKTSLRYESRHIRNGWTWKAGAENSITSYKTTSRERKYIPGNTQWNDYKTQMRIYSWGIYTSAEYTSKDERFKSSAGIRTDATAYGQLKNPLKQLSPRASMKYTFAKNWSVGGNVGMYHELPTMTTLGYKKNGDFMNKTLKYQKVVSEALGIDWRPMKALYFTLEGFHKKYKNMPLSIADNIPLACKGNDYGIFGNELLTPSAVGRTYGMELLGKWQIPEKISATASFTLYKSEYKNNEESDYIASAWDNRYILNLSCVSELPHKWSAGGKLSFIGGTPYTPYDIDKSSLVYAWDAQGRPYFDYNRYNTERLPAFIQLDIRIDKNYYFDKWRLGFYISIENVTASKLKQQDALISTNKIANPEAPVGERRYIMKAIKQESGSVVPSLGFTAEF